MSSRPYGILTKGKTTLQNIRVLSPPLAEESSKNLLFLDNVELGNMNSHIRNIFFENPL